MAQPPPGEPSELDPEGAPALPAGSLAAVAEPEPEADPSRHASYREIGRLSWPVMVSLGLANLVGLVDIAMVGRLGPDATAAVGYATQFHFLSQSVLFAVGFACTALMSRAIGAGNRLRARGAFAASLLVSFGSALAIIAFVLAPGAAWLRLLGADPAVATLTLPYLQLVIGSTLFLSVAMTFEFGMRANRDTRTPLRIAAVVAAVKIALNAVLIFGEAGFPRLELVGAGIATVVSQVVGLALFWLVAARAPREGMLRPAWQAARPIVADVVRLALPGLGERLAMNLALLVYFRVLAEYGTDAVAAYTVGIRILSFSWLPGSGFGIASATLVGQALGAGRPDAAVRAGWRTTRLALGVALALGLAGVLQRDPLAHLFVSDPGTLRALEPFLLCLAVTQPFLQVQFTLGGVHRGAGDTLTPFYAAVAGNWLLRVPLACLFVWVWKLDLVWVWYAILVDHAVRTAWLAVSFRRRAWTRSLRG